MPFCGFCFAVRACRDLLRLACVPLHWLGFFQLGWHGFILICFSAPCLLCIGLLLFAFSRCISTLIGYDEMPLVHLTPLTIFNSLARSSGQVLAVPGSFW